MVPFNSLFFFFFSEQSFMNLWPKKISKSQASGRNRSRLKTDAEKWAAYCFKQKLMVKNCWDNLKLEKKIKSSMRNKLKKSMTLLKYMYVPEAENIQLEYYKSFTL